MVNVSGVSELNTRSLSGSGRYAFSVAPSALRLLVLSGGAALIISKLKSGIQSCNGNSPCRSRSAIASRMVRDPPFRWSSVPGCE